MRKIVFTNFQSITIFVNIGSPHFTLTTDELFDFSSHSILLCKETSLTSTIEIQI